MKDKDREKVSAIESILIELMVRSENGPAWSSAVQAERIFEVVKSKRRERNSKNHGSTWR